MEFLEKEKPNIFSPPQNPKSLPLAANRAPFSSKLPEDCLYQPQDILSLFLLPNVTVSRFTNDKSPLIVKYSSFVLLGELLPSTVECFLLSTKFSIQSIFFWSI